MPAKEEAHTGGDDEKQEKKNVDANADEEKRATATEQTEENASKETEEEESNDPEEPSEQESDDQDDEESDYGTNSESEEDEDESESDEDEEAGKKRKRPDTSQASSKKQKTSGSKTQNNGTHGSKHDKADEPAPKGSNERLPKKGQRVAWKAMPGWVYGKVLEVVTEDKDMQGKHIKASKDEPRLALEAESGKFCVHKPDNCYFDDNE